MLEFKTEPIQSFKKKENRQTEISAFDPTKVAREIRGKQKKGMTKR